MNPFRTEICTLLLTLTLAAPLATAADWPQWRGPQRDGRSEESGLLESWPEGGPPRLWMFTDCGVGYSGPAVVGGRLYTMGGRDGFEQLICLDANTGNELWAAQLGPQFENNWGDGPRSTPTVDGNMIYAFAADGNLVCVRAGDGEIVWTTAMQDLGGKVPFWGYSESPLVYQAMVLCTPGGEQGTIAALDRQSGRVLWQSKDITDDAHYSSIVLMKLAGKMTGVQLLEKQLLGFDLADGALLWSIPWPGSVAVVPTPIVRGNQVYATSGYGAGCKLLSIDDQKQVEILYENKRMVNQHGGAILVDDHVYGYSDGKGWTCQEFATGDKAWHEKRALGKGAIGYADGHFYCLEQNEGDVVLIDASPAGWQEQGRFTLQPQTELRKDRGKIWTQPVISGGHLYLRDQNLLYCFDVSRNQTSRKEIPRKNASGTNSVGVAGANR
jgi:outer membrane protein assembly factor BamB